MLRETICFCIERRWRRRSLSWSWGVWWAFRRRCCRDDDRGNRLRGARSHVLLQLLRLDGLDADLNKNERFPPVSEDYFQFQMEKRRETSAHLCGLSLLLKLLELLSRDEADWFVPCDQLCSGGHRGQDDVPAQTADTARRERRPSGY